MPIPTRRDNRLRELDRLIGKALLGAESVSFVQRRRMLNLVSRNWQKPIPELLQLLTGPTSRLREILASRFYRTYLASMVGGMAYVEGKFPKWLTVELVRLAREGGLPPWKPTWKKLGEGDGDNELNFPLLVEAAKRLAERAVLTRSQWDSMDKIARDKAFFVTAPITSDVINTIRDCLVNDIDEGTSYQSFRDRIEERLDDSPIGYSQLETIYRTNVQAAFRDGRETLLRNPIVSTVFPYQAYVAIHDARARHDHLKLENMGLSGTNVFRRDDPVWDYFTPPWDYNCRCGVNVMTVEAAARAGVEEAREWLRTGQPPLVGEHRLEAVLREIQPNPNFGYRGMYVGS
jgi:SPP1 gp7 family putative phage head morphogenesis protein